jgi:hypothetical protein
MTALYSYLGSMPAPLPFRITLPSGFTRTDPSTFTPDEIAAAGYIGPIVPPEHNPETEYLAWVGGEYRVETLPPAEPTEPEPRWQEFAAALVLHPEVGPMVEAFLDALAVSKKSLVGMVYVGLGQAAQGDGQTFGNAWTLATMQGFVVPELAAAVAALAVHYDLPPEFIAALNPQAPESATTAFPEGWDPPDAPARFTTYTAPDGSEWVYDQPRNADGTYASDDPETEEVESALGWQPNG